ncbi:MAG: hypothetical protein A4E32_00425 [Methanomassiliicoccales archaeon PtaU1.Bin124]|nr:MAG: hypothetical protein A4E32_00425 [Methanomassiliicoccales archaeon PtaU1.Bin124]
MAQEGNLSKDVEDMRQIFSILSEQLPRLLESVTKVLYNAQEGEKFGASVAGFYKSLKAAGMSNQEAFELTKEYMSSLSLGGLLKMVAGGNRVDVNEQGVKVRVCKED